MTIINQEEEYLKVETNKHIRQIADLEEQIRYEKELYAQILLDNKDKINQDFINWYYIESGLNKRYLAKALDVSTNKLGELVNIQQVEVYCQRCDTKYIYQPKSLTEYNYLIGSGKRNHSDCEKKFSQEIGLMLDEDLERKKKNKPPFDYQAYLQSAHWKEFRKKILSTRNKCEICGLENDLHIHHLTYERLWHELPEDVKVLCGSCHYIVHFC